jgi:hypothetical protein
MNKIVREVAEAEVTRWLDFKKIGAKKREDHKDSIDKLIEAVEDGLLTLTDNYEFIQILKFPIGEEGAVTELKYKPRINVEAVQLQMQGIKVTDATALIGAYLAALTNTPKAILKKLDTEDNGIANAIAVFFL